MNTAKVLYRAAELVDQGWCQTVTARDAAGRICRPTSARATRWCLMGAVRQAAEEADVSRARAQVIIAVAPLFTELGLHPAAWNDAPERTADEVAAVLRRAAAWAEYGED
jgi:hypothetical protein